MELTVSERKRHLEKLVETTWTRGVNGMESTVKHYFNSHAGLVFNLVLNHKITKNTSICAVKNSNTGEKSKRACYRKMQRKKNGLFPNTSFEWQKLMTRWRIQKRFDYALPISKLPHEMTLMPRKLEILMLPWSRLLRIINSNDLRRAKICQPLKRRKLLYASVT